MHTASARNKICHEINGKGIMLTNLECYDLDKTTPGKYWYEKKPLAPGEVFEGDYTIMMRKILEAEKRHRAANAELSRPAEIERITDSIVNNGN